MTGRPFFASIAGHARSRHWRHSMHDSSFTCWGVPILLRLCSGHSARDTTSEGSSAAISALEDARRGVQIVGVNGHHAADAARAADFLDRRLDCPLTHQRAAGARMVLVAGHRRGAVVHDDDRGGAAVVGDVQQARDARVEEGGVAHDPHDLASARPPSACRAPCETPPPMHRIVSMRSERLEHAEAVAADVASHHHVEPAEARRRCRGAGIWGTAREAAAGRSAASGTGEVAGASRASIPCA